MSLLVLELQPAGLQLVYFTTDALELFGLLAQLVVCESAAVHISFYCLFEFFQFRKPGFYQFEFALLLEAEFAGFVVRSLLCFGGFRRLRLGGFLLLDAS